MPPPLSPKDLPSPERLEDLRDPLRKLLVMVRYFHNVQRQTIFDAFKRSQSRDVTIIDRLMTIAKHPDTGKHDTTLLTDLYEFIFSYYSKRVRVKVDDPAFPLLHKCFTDDTPLNDSRNTLLPPPPPSQNCFSFLYSETVRSMTAQLCDKYHGMYDYIRFATSSEPPFGAAGVVKGLIIIHELSSTMIVPTYTLLYRGMNKLGGWYTSKLNGYISLKGRRLHFLAEEEQRPHLSYMIWPADGFTDGSSGPLLLSFFHTSVMATDSGGQAFSAVAVCRRISRNVPDNIDEALTKTTIGIFDLPAVLESEEWARAVMSGEYLNDAARHKYMLELGLP